MDGNTLGTRGWYIYESDASSGGSTVQYGILTDDSLAEAAGFDPMTTPIEGLPRRFRMRYVLCQKSDDPTVRKRLWIPTQDNPLYNSRASQTVEIDGEEFVTTGRVGERMSFPILDSDPDPAP